MQKKANEMKWIMNLLIIMLLVGCENRATVSSAANQPKRAELSIGDSVLLQKKEEKRKFEEECNVWKEAFSGNVDMNFIKSIMEPISSMEWNNCYGDWTCNIEMSDNKIRLNAGGWAVAIEKDTTLIYGCKTETCWKYFLSERMCDETGNLIE